MQPAPGVPSHSPEHGAALRRARGRRQTLPPPLSSLPSFSLPLCPLSGCKFVFKEIVLVLQIGIGINVSSVTTWATTALSDSTQHEFSHSVY